jgi:hypothetical protein
MMRVLYLATIVCCAVQARMLIELPGRSKSITALFVASTMATAFYIATQL